MADIVLQERATIQEGALGHRLFIYGAVEAAILKGEADEGVQPVGSSSCATGVSSGTPPGISDETSAHLPPGWKKGSAGAQCVPSLEEAAVLMAELQALPEFLFGYVAPGAKPKLNVFLDAETYGGKHPKGMVEMLIPAGRLGRKEGLTRVTGGSSVKRLPDRKGRAGSSLSIQTMQSTHWGRHPGGVRGLIVNGGIGMYDSGYRPIVAVAPLVKHHSKWSP